MTTEALELHSHDPATWRIFWNLMEKGKCAQAVKVADDGSTMERAALNLYHATARTKTRAPAQTCQC
ncbi:uncharacterized protein N7479_000576 [Penicillium vulpinum]|uniref:uncharacterized protein n=1 Tax=Penicillium vulpinum TaxID=29845 RepID=UPI0025469387|nr:uncharacterized protein N7479_000576 [Penicillium vulpinum]KAJ5970658.1 hypothetical protein N7479_000576 [Penicillium vulpinum]